MDRTKKIYQPILKPVKPGESRERVKGLGGGGVMSYEMARFDFAKKFAQLVQDEEKGTGGEAGSGGIRLETSAKGAEEAPGTKTDPELNGTPAARETVNDSLPGPRKSDLAEGSVSPKPIPLGEGSIQTEPSTISEADDLMALMGEGEEETEERKIREGLREHGNSEHHKTTITRPDPVPSPQLHPACARHVLDKGITSADRGLFLEGRLPLSNCRV